MATLAVNGLRTVYENPTAVRQFYPFLDEGGVYLDPGERKAVLGTPFALGWWTNPATKKSLETALAQGKLAIVATPQTIVEDPTTGAVKALSANNSDVVLVDPSWGAVASAATFVINTTPNSGAYSVSASGTVAVTFSAPVTGTTIALATDTGTAVTGTTAASNSNRTYTFTPSAALTGGAAYVATISTATDANGYVVSTETVRFTVAPVVSSIVPAAAATGVALATTVVVTFNETVKNVVVSLLKSSTPVAGTLASSSKGTMWTFTPTASLTASTAYTVNVTGAVDGGNNVMAAYTSTFTTGTS